MKIKQLLVAFLIFLMAAPALAQDDCPAGHIRNPQVSQLDHDSMQAAFKASFKGLFGRDPSMQPGSGKDDGEYYIGAANHFGVYGDDQCHAGWSGYWESWLQNGHGDLTQVQTPARFLPNAAPPPVVAPPPPPVVIFVPAPPAPLPSTPLPQTLDMCRADIATVAASVEAGRQENRAFFAAVGSEWKKILVVAAPIIGALVAGLKLAPKP